MRSRTRRWAGIAALVVGLAACGGDEPAAETSVAESAEPADTEPSLPEFADALNVSLADMQRSPSGLYIEDLDEGTGLAAKEGHVVTVHYKGWLPTGELFDSNVEGEEPFSFQLGRRDVIAGWEEGVRGMRIDGKRLLVIPPDLAYGQRGYPGAIPPNAYLVFEVELLDIKM
jgi:FKBP-type peptidyl-prolyl cis-trans isomerase FkpA